MESKKFVVAVLVSGSDILAELVETDADFLYVSNPRLVGFDPQNKTIQFVDFTPHAAERNRLPISKRTLLTWYTPKKALSDKYSEALNIMSLNENGIVLPGQNPGKIIT